MYFKDVLEDACFQLLHKICLIYFICPVTRKFEREKIQFFSLFVIECEILKTFTFSFTCFFSFLYVFSLFFKRIKTKYILFSINQDSIDWYIMPSEFGILLWRSNSISVSVIHLKSHYYKEPFPTISVLNKGSHLGNSASKNSYFPLFPSSSKARVMKYYWEECKLFIIVS